MAFHHQFTPVVFLLVTACGSENGAPASPDAGPTPPIPTSSGPEGGLPGGGGTPPLVGTWGSIAEQSWELEPSKEAYWCRRVRVTQDAYVVGFRANSTKGTHHMTLASDDGPEGVFPCTGLSIGTRLLYGAGVGTDEYDFPPGVAVKLTAGQTILMNLHLYNVTEGVMKGSSGIEVLTGDPATIEHEAFAVLAGKGAGLTIAPGKTTQTGRCSVGDGTTFLALAPHMHTHGVHQRVLAHFSGDAGADASAPQTLLDRDYQFGDQHFDVLSHPVVIPGGGFLEIECTYENDSAQTLHFGESTNDEMCFANVYHYPSLAQTSICTR